MTGVPAVFLDRDGVINRSVVRNGKPYPPVSLDEVEFLPGAVHSIKRLASEGYLLIGVTNQPDVARGTRTKESIEAINALIVNVLPVVEIFTCYHDDEDACSCRKPKPGLILQGAEKYNVDLAGSWMVGDRWKDISAGQAAGVKTIFIDHHYDEVYKEPSADYVIDDMHALTGIILQSARRKKA